MVINDVNCPALGLKLRSAGGFLAELLLDLGLNGLVEGI